MKKINIINSYLSQDQNDLINKILNSTIQSVDPYCLVNQSILLSKSKVRKEEVNFSQKIHLLGLGKASVAMTQAALDTLGDEVIDGLCICKSLPDEIPDWKNIHLVQGSHPIPDERSLQAGKEVRQFVSAFSSQDLLMVLISGGASALVVDPQENISLEDIQRLNGLLLKSGATINEINCVRKHLERLKGGGLARLASPARIESLILSDVIGNDISSIASGPTVADDYTFAEAMTILEKYKLEEIVPQSITQHLQKGINGVIPETLKRQDPILQNVDTQIIGSNQTALEYACEEAKREGLIPIKLSGHLVGEASDAAEWFMQEAKGLLHKATKSFMAVAGGETTVTIKGQGVGGRNLELALAAVNQMSGLEKSCLITLTTDGEDGPTDAAGAIVHGKSLADAIKQGLDPDEYLARNDSYTFFKKTGGLIKTGSTGTNVNDFTFFFYFS